MYAHVAKGQWDAVAGFMADDFVIHEPASLPYGGEWRGRDALHRLYGRVMCFWDEPEVTWLELVGGERHTVALLDFAMTALGTGRRIAQRVAEVTTFDDAGKMAAMHIHYFDATAMVEALQA